MNNKKKLLSLTNRVLEYRIPVYNQLAEKYDITIAHHGKKVNEENLKFKQIILNPIKRGPFITFKENITELAMKYDAVIALGDLHYWSLFKLSFLKNRAFSLTFWSIGVSASYNKHFDEDRKLDYIRFRLMNKADSIVFYTSYPIKRYVQDGKINRDKLFVANNTIEVQERIDIPNTKNHFLFVGTLYKAKKIFDLLDAYYIAYKKNDSLKPLIIIGDGEEKTNAVQWVQERGITHKVSFKGAIFEQELLKQYYQYAIACISPGQAGLTVLNSLAYGVPYVTTKDAITGGEIFNINHNENGIIYKERIVRLAEIILDLSTNIEKVNSMSKNAQEFYFKNSTMPIMVKGLDDAITYALNHTNKSK
jgi:glycosyltransferase involved in cell wall biosynthesis